jgi:hypothetical protein
MGPQLSEGIDKLSDVRFGRSVCMANIPPVSKALKQSHAYHFQPLCMLFEGFQESL